MAANPGLEGVSVNEFDAGLPRQPVGEQRRALGPLIARNAGINLLRLAGTGVVALFLPPFLVRELPKPVYGAWALLLQLTLYVSYLDFGIQTAIARFVAHADELNDKDETGRILSTAFVMLLVAAALGWILIGMLAWQLPRLFHQMPSELYRSGQIALVLMGCSFALGLPASVVSAFFTGLQRNAIPAAIAIGNKVAMCVLLIGVVLSHSGLAAMGAAAGIANLASYAAAFVVFHRCAPRLRLRLALFSKVWLQKIGYYSSSVVVWMAAMLMISGLDLIIVGIFDYQATAYYAIAATLTNFVAQVQGAIFAALLPASAVLSARGDAAGLGRLLVSSTRYGMLILLAMALPLVGAGHYILRVWAGGDYAAHSTIILQVLVAANVVRLAALPYATLLLGTGQQKKVLVSPLAEGITNLVASIIGAHFLGAIGVALGTLAGSFVSLGSHLFYNMPRTQLISFSRFSLIATGFLRPLAVAIPAGAVILFLTFSNAMLVPWQPYITAVLVPGTALLFWLFGLTPAERSKIGHVLLFSPRKSVA